ncbi:MAG TPA: DUF4956 domain-containing protein [Pyrinomonadaceae bacterium]|nr:DUF4956 domain-containing protein [Pyrinomonadaceae bacterium]
MNKLTLALLGTFAAILLLSGALAYAFREQPHVTTVESPATPAASPSPGDKASNEKQKSQNSDQAKQNGGHNAISELFGLESPSIAPSTFANWESIAARVALRFSLAAFLAALLAFRPRRGVSYSRRNPYVAQTQILMAVVAGAMMMVVGDSAARAFGIFAAASLVRFRTNIRDPKEITVLLICLGVGLAAGVGRWDMAIILALFVLLALAILEYFEEAQVFRSMQVSVATRNTDTTHEVLKRLFKKNRFDTELRELNRPDEDKPMGKIVYVLNMKASVNTDRLSEEIIASDADNIDTVEWEQKVSETYIYK